MKRSQIIKIVSKEVEPILNNGFIGGEGLTTKGMECLVDIVLKSLEKVGMRPPVEGSLASHLAACHNEWEEE